MVDEFEQPGQLMLSPGPTRGFLADMREYFPPPIGRPAGVQVIRKGVDLSTDTFVCSRDSL